MRIDRYVVPDKLLRAITDQLVIVIDYYKDPKTAGERTVHPHVLFKSSGDKVCLHAVQIDGPTSGKQNPPFWRQFDMDFVELKSVEAVRFTPSDELNLTNTKIYRKIFIDCLNGLSSWN